MHVVRQQHPSLDHKRMGHTKPSDRFPQGRAHIDIGEKGLAPISVDREEIGATRHMGATVTRHGGIIPPMNGAGTRPTLAMENEVKIMKAEFTAIVKRDGDWWLGWVEEIPGANAQEKTREELILSLKEAVKDILDLRCEEARNQAEDDFEEVPLVI
jgi:predicted RNase H-like HicB family nuclease